MKKLLLSAFLPMLILSASTLFAQNYNLQLRSTLDFPGQTLANVSGFSQNGREYALVGASLGLAIVEVTNPNAPVLIVQIPGPNNLWKEIKTYGHYAYITSEGGQGLQIVDLSGLPGANLNSYFYTGDGVIAGQLDKIHSLHIDTTRGFLYAYGGSLFNGGAKILDLNTDPYNPVYVGKFDQLNYIHDGYVDNDTLYACHINDGYLSIVNMQDKNNPELLGTVETPARFTHNSWLLSDRKHILTTDEKFPSFVAAYDIADPSNIRELDRIATTVDGNSSIGHNTHVLNDWAVTSWYTDGVTIIDAHRPENLIQVGRYDTYAGTGVFDGCWGAYPYFPSGTIIASNIPNIGDNVTGKLFVLTPTYVRACYLEGTVTSTCTGQALINATVTINSNDPLAFTQTKNDGSFKTGQPTPGNFTVTVSKAGFISQTTTLELTPGEITPLHVNLEPISAFSIVGTVLDAQSGQPLANVPVQISSPLETFNRQTNAAGQFNLTCAPGATYQVSANAWGYLPANFVLENGGGAIISLQRGYFDDFGFNLNWSKSGNASTGDWVRGNPVGTFLGNMQINPENDVDSDGNELCYITGNGGGDAGDDDVDGGDVVLSSPLMLLSDYQEAVLSFWYWFVNSGGNSAPNDRFEVVATNGLQTVTIFADSTSQAAWQLKENVFLSDYITLTDSVRIHFITGDTSPGHLVEAGVDVFHVVPAGFVSTKDKPDPAASLLVLPNPSAADFTIRYEWPLAGDLVLEVRNTLGQLVFTQQLNGNTGSVTCGEAWPNGIYLASMRHNSGRSVPVKMLKQ